MKITKPHSDAVRLIRFAAILWIGYLVVLAALSQSFWDLRHGYFEAFYFETFYYIFLGLVALLCLGLAYWPWVQKRLGRIFIPVIVIIITVMPVIANQLMGRFSPLGPRFSAPEGSVLAIFPFLFVALLLVAWQYKWPYILLVILGIAGLNLGITWSLTGGPGTRPFLGGLIVTLIQTVIFLAVGFSISYLMNRLRGQQQSLEAANIRLTHYASTLEQLATSRERNRLALELHDTLAHTLSGLSVQLETVKAYWDIDPLAARSTLEKSLAAAHSGLEETRRALKALRASPLDDLGLVLAMRTRVEDAATRANLILNLSIADGIPALSPDIEQCIYRIAQEAVTNVVKHASAKNLTVRLESIEGKVKLIVCDDGVGFYPQKIDNASHFGLTGMQERAHLVGGELNVASKPGEGTTVKLTI